MTHGFDCFCPQCRGDIDVELKKPSAEPPPWSEEPSHESCLGRIECPVCKKFHGYCSDVAGKIKQGGSMKVNRDKYDMGGGKFLKANMVKDHAIFTIDKFEELQTRLGVRPVLRLKGVDEPFGLNATNLDWMIDKYGDDSDKWINKKIRIGKVRVNNPQTGKMQDGLRIE